MHSALHSTHVLPQEPQQSSGGQQQHIQDLSQHEQQHMAVLEALEPVQPQPILSVLDPVETHHQQHHMQQQMAQPELHQLQVAASIGCDEQQVQMQLHAQPQQDEEQQQQQQQQQQEQQQQQHRHSRSHALQGRQRNQLENIGDGSGPIVQWLMENYETADGESLPRSTVYNHYLAHCRTLQMASVNAASFGKLIRSVFMGLKTRRLGTRGHSKYHYFGVRAKPHVRLDWLVRQRQEFDSDGVGCSSRAENDNSNHNTSNGSESDSAGECGGGAALSCGRRESSSSAGGVGADKRSKRTHLRRPNDADQQQQHYHLDEQHNDGGHHNADHYATQNGLYYVNEAAHAADSENNYIALSVDEGQKQHVDHLERPAVWPIDQVELLNLRNHLGANWANLVDDHWPHREQGGSLERQMLAELVGDSCACEELINLLSAFETTYKSYCKRMVALLSELKCIEIEQLWAEFWRPQNGQQLDLGGGQAGGQQQQQQQQQHKPLEHTTTRVQWNGHAAQVGAAPQLQPDAASQQADYQHHLHLQHQHEQQQQHLHHHHHQLHQQQQVITTHSNSLTFSHLYQLTSHAPIVARIIQIDYNIFAAVESFLIPDILSPIPRQLAEYIRMFAKNFASWTELAIKDYAQEFVEAKLVATRSFGHALRRCTSINHLSGASRVIWNRRPILAQMYNDLSRIDRREIEHQVSLMDNSSGGTSRRLQANNATVATTPSQQQQVTTNQVGCQQKQPVPMDQVVQPPPQPINLHQDNNNENIAMLDQQYQQQGAANNNRLVAQSAATIGSPLCPMQPAKLIQDLLQLLEDPYPANSWPDWCRNRVESFLGTGGGSFEEARIFILKWNFYNSLIMKELTLKSAPSLGSFQLIRLLFDEYIYYLVVSRLARANHKTSAQLLSLSYELESI